MNISNEIARRLTLIENDKVPKEMRKQVSDSHILLKPFAKELKIREEEIIDELRENRFFRIEDLKVKRGILRRREKSMQGVTWESMDALESKFVKDPLIVLNNASQSLFLLARIESIIAERTQRILAQPLMKEESIKSREFEPTENLASLYRKYLPKELEKYERERAKRIQALGKKIDKKVPKGKEFYFRDGSVANSILSWVKSLLSTDNETIAEHLKTGEFERWLRDAVNSRELAGIASSLALKLKLGKVSENSIKAELLGELKNTGVESVIYEMIIKPLIENLDSGDRDSVINSVNKLKEIRDERAVEPLIEKLYDSDFKTRIAVISALGEIGDKRATLPLIKTLQNSTFINDRIMAIRALAKIGDERAVEPLKDVALERSEVGEEARCVLEMFKG